MSNVNKLTVGEIKEWQERKNKIKTFGEFKKLGRELADKHGLTDREAIDVLNGNILNN
jgi:hypothetical protein